MTFIARAAQEAVYEFEAKYGTGAREEFIRHHIMQNFYAFELMMAPYAVGHLKMSFFLEELGHRLGDDERIRFYLTNTLDTDELEQSRLPGLVSLAEESRLAGIVKKQTPILVILGNPPYSAHSTNKGKWILDRIADYMEVDGKPLGEQNPKGLYDDYVKFLRFAQWKIEQTGRGIVGIITSHSYLDSPTFRGMRSSLMRTFDDIYILDVHGNSLKRETCPDGNRDENVFDIRQGVCIAFFVKRDGREKRKVIHHAHLWGNRESKYKWLAEHSINNTDWKKITPQSPFYLFVPRCEQDLEHYQTWLSVPDLFPVGSTGIKTHRDHFVIDFDRDELKRRILLFCDRNLSDDWVRLVLKLKDTRDWKMSERRNRIQQDSDWEAKIHKCLYRPFDVRWLFYHPDAVELSRFEIMHHMMQPNIALCIGRAGQVVGSGIWNLVFCSSMIEDTNCFYRGGSLNLPLYLYSDTKHTKHRGLFIQHEPQGRQPNLNLGFIAKLTDAYGQKPSPEEIFYYVYAILHSIIYREKYAEYLRTDFPRIPFTAEVGLFTELAALGQRLVELHLLRSDELDPPACRFEGVGDNRIDKDKKKGGRYYPLEQRVYINATQYFGPVSQEVWAYHIGGYQVCAKWLKDRTNRRLDLDDIRTYCRIVTAIMLTIGIQQEIDALYTRVESNTITV